MAPPALKECRPNVRTGRSTSWNTYSTPFFKDVVGDRGAAVDLLALMHQDCREQGPAAIHQASILSKHGCELDWAGIEFIADRRMWLPCLYWSFFLDSRRITMEAPLEDMGMPPTLMCARSSYLNKPQKPRLMAAARDRLRSWHQASSMVPPPY